MKPELKIVPRQSARIQARLAIATHEAEKNGARLLSDAEVARIDGRTVYECLNGEPLIDQHAGFEGLNWQHVLECKVPLNIFGCADRARAAGYRFCVYAGSVYFIPQKGNPEDTGLTVEDIRP